MVDTNIPQHDVGAELANVPMGQLVHGLAMSIAEAQTAMDVNSMRQVEMMSGRYVVRDERGLPLKIDNHGVSEPMIAETLIPFGYTTQGEGKNAQRVTNWVSMLELGFIPNFYQFVDTMVEVKIEIKITESLVDQEAKQGTVVETHIDEKAHATNHGWWRGQTTTNRRVQVTATPIDAFRSNKYNYNIEGASLLRTKLVPVPPPALLEERIRQVMEDELAYREERNKT